MQLKLSFKQTRKQSAWRPDFRQTDTLPDIKPIRTGFILNLIGTLALILAISGVVNNYNTTGQLTAEVVVLQQKIDANNRANRQYIQQHNEFQAAARLSEQVVNFLAQRIDPLAVVADLAANRPASITIESIALAPTIVRVRNRDTVQYNLSLQGTVRDTESSDASTLITEFRNSLDSLPSLQPVLENTRLNAFTRTPNPAVFNFTIQVSLNPDK